MQPIAIDQDYTRTPLNELFGSKANVRLLRLLANEVSGPIGAPEAAEQVGLTEAGARRALKRLARTGFVELIGGGRAQTFRIRESDPLSRAIRELFRVEQVRHETFLDELRAVLAELDEIDLAWIDQPSSGAGEPLHVGVLADATSLTHLEREIRERIVEIEGRFDLTIEIHPFSHSELDPDELRMKKLLAGYVAAPTTGGTRPPHPGTHEERSRRMSEAIAGMLDRDPSLRRRAERHIESLLSAEQGPAAHDLREWRNVLAHYSSERLKDFLRSDTARAERLRRSSPFFAVLTHEERDELMASLGAGE